jgi:protein-disulfide isomerase
MSKKSKNKDRDKEKLKKKKQQEEEEKAKKQKEEDENLEDELEEDDDLDEEDDEFDEDEEDDEEEDDDEDEDEDDDDDEDDEDPKEFKKKKQNYIAAIFILIGLLGGSLFVDIAQLVTGQGISSKKLAQVKEAGMFSLNDDQTWVLKEEPIVTLSIYNDPNCEACQENVDEFINGIKQQALPTMVIDEKDVNDENVQEELEELEIEGVPAFIFDEKVTETAFYNEGGGQQFLTEQEGKYVLNNQAVGFPYAKYLQRPDYEVPEFQSDVQILGNQESEVPVIVFGDFQCPYSKLFATNFSQVIDQYQEDIKVTFKHFPLDFHPQAELAANASMCANEQGKFWEMYDAIFERQSEWGAQDATDASAQRIFSEIAANVGLNVSRFNTCLNQKKFQDVIDENLEMVNSYPQVSGTPTVFIGTRFYGGGQVGSAAAIRNAIENEIQFMNQDGQDEEDTQDEDGMNEDEQDEEEMPVEEDANQDEQDFNSEKE